MAIKGKRQKGIGKGEGTSRNINKKGGFSMVSLQG